MTIDRKPTRRLPGAAAWTALPVRMRALLAGAGGIVILLLVWVLSGAGAGRPVPGPSSASSPVAQASDVDSGVPALDSCRLLEPAELDAPMGLLDLPMDQRSMFEFAGGEACTWINSRDGVDVEGLSVRIEPGAVEDFQPGASLGGVIGVPSSGVGQLAMWFGGERTGTLSVTSESSVGQLFFRVIIARPDLEADAILPLATKLAAVVLPRFPGMAASEPRTIVIEPEPADTSADGYVDNLLAKEVAGTWTREEGLIASLRLLVGEAQPEDVLLHSEVLDASGTGIVALAREYLASGPAGAGRDEIERLLGKLLSSGEEMRARAGQAGSATRPAVPGGAAAILASVHEPQADRVTATQDDECGGAPAPCVITYTTPETEELDILYGPDRFLLYAWSNYQEMGWTNDRMRWITQALNRAVKTFMPLGRMPGEVSIVAVGGGATDILVGGDAQACELNVYPALQGQPEGEFKQRITGELAFCYEFATFPARAHSESARWWRDGLAVYLSNVAYPAVPCTGLGTGESAVPQSTRCDLEWKALPAALANTELGKAILDRSSTNAFFFQDLFWSGGNEGIRSLIDKLQTAESRADQEAVLANHDGTPKRLHDYVVRLTDSLVQDTGGGFVPYAAPAEQIEAQPARLTAELVPFGTTRWHVTVPGGRKACLETTMQGEVQHSWRAGDVGPQGVLHRWETIPPAELEDEAILVFTTARPDGEITVEIKLVDSDEECEPEPSPETGSDGCPRIICQASRFFRVVIALPEWFREMLE